MIRCNLEFRIVDFNTFRVQIAGDIPNQPVGQGFQVLRGFGTFIKIIRYLFAGHNDIRIVFRNIFRQQPFLAG